MHLTVGVYSNDTCKRNTVDPKHLAEHQDYNLRMRPGRAFFVDGVCIAPGYLTKDQVSAWTAKMKDWKPGPTATVPYQ